MSTRYFDKAQISSYYSAILLLNNNFMYTFKTVNKRIFAVCTRNFFGLFLFTVTGRGREEIERKGGRKKTSFK